MTVVSMTSISEKTVCKYFDYFRELVCSALNYDDCVIGGEGITVEVDESKFGESKLKL